MGNKNSWCKTVRSMCSSADLAVSPIPIWMLFPGTHLVGDPEKKNRLCFMPILPFVPRGFLSMSGLGLPCALSTSGCRVLPWRTPGRAKLKGPLKNGSATETVLRLAQWDLLQRTYPMLCCLPQRTQSLFSDVFDSKFLTNFYL